MSLKLGMLLERGLHPAGGHLGAPGRAGRTTSSARPRRTCRSMGNRLEKIRKEKPRDAGRIHVKLEESGKVGKNLVLADRLGFSYDGRRWLFRSADFYVQRSDRVAIIGPNGSGKTRVAPAAAGRARAD